MMEKFSYGRLNVPNRLTPRQRVTMTSSTTNPLNPSNPTSTVTVTCETLEAECNVLGMELLNVLEYIGDSVDYRKITLLVQKLSNSMDFIANGVNKLKNVNFSASEIEQKLEERRNELIKLQTKLKLYQSVQSE